MLLSPAQCALFLDLRSRGASPAVACQQLGVEYAAFARTLAADAEFREQMRQVEDRLAENVAAALYRSAMEGSVTAQKFWLQAQPPAEWLRRQAADADTHLLDDLSDAELLELALALGLEIPVDARREAEEPPA